MSYTPITCELTETIQFQACLTSAFVDYTVYPLTSPNYHRVLRDNGTGAFLGYASYIDNGTDQSFFTDQADRDLGNFGGFYTGSKFMAVTKIGTDYHVGYVSQAYTDPDDLTAPALTTANIGNAGTTPGNVNYNLCGRSEAGGDRISWLEDQTTSVHFLTATTSGLTRQQAFPIGAGESYSILTAYSNGWVYDGTDYWYVTRLGSGGSYISAPFKCLLIRFKPTTVGDPYDYEKFEITFSDDTVMDIFDDYGVNSKVAGTEHMVSVYGGYNYATQRPIGRTRYFTLSKDCTSYTEYVIEGDQAVADFAFNNVPGFTHNASGDVRLIGWAFDTASGGYPTGTYDLTCTGGSGHQQAAAYAETIQRKAPLTQTITGNRITAGDMQSGSDKRVTSTGDTRIWRDMIDGR